MDSDTSDDEYVTCDEDSDSDLSFNSSSYISSRSFRLPSVEPQSSRVFNERRFVCLSRPQYKRSCGISSLISVFNFLFSAIGSASSPILHSPLTQEEALRHLGYQEPFEDIKFGKFTGNLKILDWFRDLCDKFQIAANSYILYKPRGRQRTCGVTASKALNDLKAGLALDKFACIYHCENHYFVPIGYDESPDSPDHAYSVESAAMDTTSEHTSCGKGPSLTTDTWILVGEPSRKFPPVHCIRWSDIQTDLQTSGNDFLDVRRLDRGMQKRRKAAAKCSNRHCLIAFERLD